MKFFIKEDYGLILILLALIITPIFFIHSFSIPIYSLNANPSYYPVLFATTFLLLLSISGILFYAWTDHRNNKALLVWAAAFLAHALPFLIGIFDYSLTLFAFRFGLIAWVAGMYLGIALILSKKKGIGCLPAIGLLIVAIAWVALDIVAYEFIFSIISIFVFFHLLISPVLAILTYSFYIYSIQSKLSFPKWLVFGFTLLTVAFFIVPITRPEELMRSWAILYVTALFVVLFGFCIMCKELNKKRK